MGKSRPPESHVDLVGSFARVDGADVEIVLAEPTLEVGDGDVVVLRRGDRRRRATHELVDDGAGRRLVVRVPRHQLDDGSWALRLRSGQGSTHWGCRLLVQGDRPVVLLWGRRPADTHEPAPRAGRGQEARRVLRRVAAATRTRARGLTRPGRA